MSSKELIQNLYPERKITKKIEYDDDYDLRHKVTYFTESGLPITCYAFEKAFSDGEHQSGVIVQVLNNDGLTFSRYYGGVLL